jgi:hypothetical protein
MPPALCFYGLQIRRIQKRCRYDVRRLGAKWFVLGPKQEIEMILRRTEGAVCGVPAYTRCAKLLLGEPELREAARIHVCDAALHIRFRSRAGVWPLRCASRLTESVCQAEARSAEGDMLMTMTKVLGLVATGALLVLAMPAQHANAVSLINPGAAAAAQDDAQFAARQMTTEVHWHHHWHHGYHRHWHHRHW